MKISIVIVNYNVKHYVEQCLLSVERALQGMTGEVYVVDNKSTDNSVEYLKAKFPWVYFIKNDFNAGFSKANNQALRVARGEYVMLLNPDTIIGENTLRDCISFLDAHPDAGGAGGCSVWTVRSLRSQSEACQRLGHHSVRCRVFVPSSLRAAYSAGTICSLSHRTSRDR